MNSRFVRLAAMPLAAALMLAACGEADEPEYEADATDVSGGELIVTDETPAVPVDLPDTPMTNVPADTSTGDATMGETEPAEPAPE